MRRHSIDYLNELLCHFPCVAILGVRQCGKTTMLQMLPKEWRLFDLEKRGDRQQIAHDPDLFFRLHSDRIVIDEVQTMPAVFEALRVAIDADRGRKGRFVITGSSSPDLMQAVSESLAGRVAIIELSPFSCAEAHSQEPSEFFEIISEAAAPEALLHLESRLTLAQTTEHWRRGGYPEPWLSKSDRVQSLWMQNYLSTYVDRDILQLFPNLNRDRFRTFVQMLGHLSGSVINVADVARALAVSQPTAREYFNIAHGTFIWRQLPAYHRDATKRVVKHPKGYLRDSGLLHHLLHIPKLDSLLSHPSMGLSFEAMVIENIFRGFNNRGTPFEASHYRTSAGAEVDLVLEGPFGVLPVEIKYTQTLNMRRLRGLKDFISERYLTLGLVIHNGEEVRQLDDQIVAIPIGCL